MDCECKTNNPTGAVLTKEEMKMIVEIAKQDNLWLLVDETYRELVYDGRKPLSFLQLNEYEEGIIVLESLSKKFSLCGLRVGAFLIKIRIRVASGQPLHMYWNTPYIFFN